MYGECFRYIRRRANSIVEGKNRIKYDRILRITMAVRIVCTVVFPLIETNVLNAMVFYMIRCEWTSDQSTNNNTQKWKKNL